MKYRLFQLISLGLAFVLIFPEIAFAVVDSSIMVSWNIADTNGDGFSDLEFTAVNLIGSRVPGVQVSVSPEGALVSIDDMPLLSKVTGQDGKTLFKSMPGGRYVWRTSGIKSSPDSIEIEDFEIETKEEDLFLEWFLFMEWMPTASSEKGRIFFEGLARLCGYDLVQNPLPRKTSDYDNFRISKEYLAWLGDFEDFVDLRESAMPFEFWSYAKRAIAIPRGALSLAAGLPKTSRTWLTISRTGRIKDGKWVEFTEVTLNNHRIVYDKGLVFGGMLIVLSILDLVNLFPDSSIIFDPSGEPAEKYEMVFQIASDIASLASGVITVGLSLAAKMRLLVAGGKIPTQQLVTISRGLAIVGVVLNVVLTILHLWTTYKTWENFVANFWTADVILSFLSLGVSAVMLAVLIWNIAIPIVGWIILGAVVVASFVYYIYEFLVGYWDKIDDYRIQLGNIFTDLMDIREILHSINIEELQKASALNLRFALVSQKFSSIASGQLKDDFLWAENYLDTLGRAQQALANKVLPAREALDLLIGRYLWYESSDRSKRVSGLAVGVNSTAAQYSTPGSSGFFAFNASIWHPSAGDSSVFTFDWRRVTKNLDSYGIPRPSILSEETYYGAIADVAGGWAWDVPATHDTHKDLLGNYDHFFAASCTTDTAHVPPGGTNGKEFYFDDDSQDYTKWPTYFNPMIYADESAVIPDPKTHQMRSRYIYKFYFDSDTTKDFFGHYTALDEWSEAVKAYIDSGVVKQKLEEVSSAIDHLEWASARKRIAVSSVDAVLVIDRSGSMSGNKIESAKASAKQFVDLMQSGDMIGIVSYETGAGVNYQLTGVTSSVKLAVKSSINSIYSGGTTAIGAGLRTAYNQLVTRGDSSHAWAIVLMSDGLHNTGEHPYNVIPDLQAKNIVVYTIGLGTDADGALLSYIASKTGGFYRFSPTIEQLMGIYSDIATKVTGAQTISSTSGSIAQGETVQQAVNVDSSATQATFAIGWGGSDLDLSLIRPDGQLVDPNVAAIDPKVEYVEEATYEMYRISDPMAGVWTMVIVGVSIHTISEDFIARVTAITSVTLGLSTDKDSYIYPDPIRIVVTLLDMGVGVKGSSVLATLTRPGGEKLVAVLLDDGLPVHGDYLLNDGIYTNFYREFSKDGSYTIDVVASGTTYTGEFFSRSAQKTVLVSGIPTDATPPTTVLTIGEPKYISDATYVAPDTPFTLEATDTGSGIYSTAYRIYTATYDGGWQTYTAPFKLTSLIDGAYTIEYNSTDNVGNVETTQAVTVTLFSWKYVFEDSSGRGTILRVNTEHGLFQFVAPDTDYGLRNATFMFAQGNIIRINHDDGQLRIIAVAVGGKLDVCIASAYDRRTDNRYLLVDKAGVEVPHRHGTAVLI